MTELTLDVRLTRMSRDVPGLYSIGISTADRWPPHPALQGSTTYRTLEEAQQVVGGPHLVWVHTKEGVGHYWDADLGDGRRARISEALGIFGVETSNWPRAS